MCSGRQNRRLKLDSLHQVLGFKISSRLGLPSATRERSGVKQASELQFGDELYVPRAAVAEIWIERIRRTGRTEPRAESR